MLLFCWVGRQCLSGLEKSNCIQIENESIYLFLNSESNLFCFQDSLLVPHSFKSFKEKPIFRTKVPLTPLSSADVIFSACPGEKKDNFLSNGRVLSFYCFGIDLGKPAGKRSILELPTVAPPAFALISHESEESVIWSSKQLRHWWHWITPVLAGHLCPQFSVDRFDLCSPQTKHVRMHD